MHPDVIEALNREREKVRAWQAEIDAAQPRCHWAVVALILSCYSAPAVVFVLLLTGVLR